MAIYVDGCYFLEGLGVGEDLLEEGVLGVGVETQGEGTVAEGVHVGREFGDVQEVCLLQRHFLLLLQDEEAQHQDVQQT
jgi:hypothetical protein